jgi:hypothetical protein
MLRNDGKYEICTIEAKPVDDKYNSGWFGISFDGSFKWGKRWYPDYSGKEYEPYESFSASGKCWQETGIHGTYDVEKAIKLYLILIELNPEYMFRVNKKTILQESEILWCGSKKKKQLVKS